MKPPTEDLLSAAHSREIAAERIDVRTVDEIDAALLSSIGIDTEVGSSHCNPKVIVPRQSFET